MIILIMGPQGSGKGTQAKRIAQEFQLSYLDVGALLRKIAKKDARINEIVNKRGALLPDEEIFQIITQYLEDKKLTDNLVLDGYPRSIRQYSLISNWFKTHGNGITKALFLNISEDESVKRLSARRYHRTSGKIFNLLTKPPKSNVDASQLIQREDDKPEAIKERLSHYRETTAPLVELLRKEGKLVEIDGERPIEIIHDEMINIVKNLK